MPDSKREAALKALVGALSDMALLETLQTLTGPVVLRNAVTPEEIPAEGLVIVRDGTVAELEAYLGNPPTQLYAHTAELECVVQAGTARRRDAALDELLGRIDQTLTLRKDLWGTVDVAYVDQIEVLTDAIEGAPAIKAARVSVIMEYTATSPLA